MTNTSRHTGNYYEKIAADFLIRHGLTLTHYHYQCRGGEIDLIMQDGDYLVFVEVRYREQGGSLESIDLHKQRHLLLCAEHYLLQNNLFDKTPCRFDVIAIDGSHIEWIKNAIEQ
ncbi:MAG: YraN family protein [Legionellales bacterium]|nr:YraN family protein [Legionellales bacterium]